METAIHVDDLPKSLRASARFLFMRGQYSGNGQLVKKNVKATALP